ncbi:helix-turn-helix transcriptional regulator [Streptomyces sp. NPDC001795]|uniref:response regulator transcription factor n=1 Tax=Streptomyces sp. NPDC001795 TaxID=3154525 RepID=UPI0033331E65
MAALGTVVHWDAARVRAELRAHPGNELPARGQPRYDERLSPREQEAAELAGAGLSDREIATTLRLSPRTVEQHVARALGKPGVASRNDRALKARDKPVRRTRGDSWTGSPPRQCPGHMSGVGHPWSALLSRYRCSDITYR